MPDEKQQSTELAKRDRSFSELVRAGANLTPEQWDEARIAAVRKMLPTRFQDAASTIAFLARAERSELDPFLNELWAWEHKGDLQFMVGRDGWLKLARKDNEVEGVAFGLIHEKDDFTARQEGSRVHVEHEIGFPRGKVLGAYCVVHMREPEDDHLVTREVDDYSHLHGKSVWQDYGQDMLLTRVISVAVKMKVPAGAGLHSKAEFELREDATGKANRRVGEATDARADALAEELEAEEAVEVEAEEVEPQETDETPDESDTEEAEAPTPAGEPDEPSGGEPAAESDDEPEEKARTVACRICTDPVKGSGLGGHMAGHSKRGETLPEDYAVLEGYDGYYFRTADGELVGSSRDLADRIMGEYATWEDALRAANGHAREHLPELFEDEEGTEEPDEDASEAQEAPASASDEDETSWGDQYTALLGVLEAHDRGGDMGFLRDQAEKLYPECVKDGTPQIRELSVEQLQGLAEEVEEELS